MLKEFIDAQEFAKRCQIGPGYVRRAIKEGIIIPENPGAARGRGHDIDWNIYWRPFAKWMGGIELLSRGKWSTGKREVVKHEPRTYADTPLQPANEEVEEQHITDDLPPLDETISDEKLMELLGKNISSVEADRVRKIIKARRELLQYKKDEELVVEVASFIPRFTEIATLLRKGIKAIPPRVAPQCAAMTDHFKINKLLESELNGALELFDDFIKGLQKNA
jgi:hypothetical protein